LQRGVRVVDDDNRGCGLWTLIGGIIVLESANGEEETHERRSGHMHFLKVPQPKIRRESMGEAWIAPLLSVRAYCDLRSGEDLTFSVRRHEDQ
jgi:hypothetical protein